MLILLWQAAVKEPTPGAGGGSGYMPITQRRIIDDPRFDLHAIEEEVIIATIVAFLRTRQ
jgi:hypothetical protein